MNTARGALRSRGRSAAGFPKRIWLASSATPTLPANVYWGRCLRVRM